MKKKTFYTAIITLCLLNIWLLYINEQLVKSVNVSQIQPNMNIKSTYSNDWGYEQFGESIGKIVHPDIPELNDIKLIALFTDIGCQFTVEHDVVLLNNLYKKYPDKIKIYLLSNNESFLKRLFNAKFPYEIIDINHKVLNNNFDFINPVSIISGNKSIVQILHISEKDNEMKSNMFFEKMDALLSSL